ncbi:MAG: hypothetical protein U9P71_09455 [Campylobacterota bacterium]|nr:hypothetical protein [Campylobacterota bacterium]
MRTLTLFFIATAFIFTACSSEVKKLPYNLEISHKGIGLINSETPFETAIISSKLLGFDAQKFTFFEAGTPRPIIRVTFNDKEMALIYPTKNLKLIHSIIVLNSDVKNFDATIGMNLEDINQKKFTCKSSDEDITCKLNYSNTLEYLFKNKILKEIIWTPIR